MTTAPRKQVNEASAGGLGRAAVLAKLETVAPAMSDGRIVKILSHIWFTGQEVMCFDDNIAIAVPFEQDQIIGAVPGKLLIDFMRVITRNEIQFTRSDNQVLLTATNSSMKAKFPLLPPEEFVFSWPEAPNDPGMSIVADDVIRTAIKACMRSIGSDGHIPETRGVTIVASETKVVFYATDSATLTRALAPGHTASKTFRAILPTAFCEQLIALSKKEGLLTITENYAEFVNDDVRLYGRLLGTAEPLDFESTIERVFPSNSIKQAVAIPGNLSEVLTRACIITKDTATSEALTIFTVKDSVLKIEASTERGSNKDVIKLTGHPNVVSNLVPQRIQKAIDDGFSKILIKTNCTALIADNEFYLVSASG